MKRYALRSCRARPSLESSSDTLVNLGDVAFPVNTRASLENGMGMRVMISIIVGIVVGIITKFFTSSDDGSASLQNSIDEYNDAIDKYKNDVAAYDTANSATWNNISNDIVEDMWQKQHVRTFVKSNMYSIVMNEGGLTRKFSELVLSLCIQTSTMAGVLSIAGRTAVGDEFHHKFLERETKLIEGIYPLLEDVCKPIGIEVGPQKGVMELLSTLNEVVAAMRQEGSAVTDQQAKKKLKAYVDDNRGLSLDKMMLDMISSDEKDAGEQLTKAKSALTQLESHLEKRDDITDKESVSGFRELGKLTSMCGKYLGLTNALIQSSMKLSDTYVSSMKKVGD